MFDPFSPLAEIARKQRVAKMIADNDREIDEIAEREVVLTKGIDVDFARQFAAPTSTAEQLARSPDIRSRIFAKMLTNQIMDGRFALNPRFLKAGHNQSPEYTILPRPVYKAGNPCGAAPALRKTDAAEPGTRTPPTKNPPVEFDDMRNDGGDHLAFLGRDEHANMRGSIAHRRGGSAVSEMMGPGNYALAQLVNAMTDKAGRMAEVSVDGYPSPDIFRKPDSGRSRGWDTEEPEETATNIGAGRKSAAPYRLGKRAPGEGLSSRARDLLYRIERMAAEVRKGALDKADELALMLVEYRRLVGAGA